MKCILIDDNDIQNTHTILYVIVDPATVRDLRGGMPGSGGVSEEPATGCGRRSARHDAAEYITT